MAGEIDNHKGLATESLGEHGGATEELRPHSRVLKSIYWLIWFFSVPAFVAVLLVWALTPPSGVERTGVLGTIESFVREQPVPMLIVLFTLVEMALWSIRQSLPLSRFAHPPLRDDVPDTMRGPFERARLLLEEAETIMSKNVRAFKREYSEREREEVREHLERLRAAMHKRPFSEAAFHDAHKRADATVDATLSRWRKSEVREYLEAIVMAISVALGLRAFVVEAFKIPSGSMVPTLQDGDHIFVNKFSYGPAIPWTKSRLWSQMPPSRGDVMVFASPEQPNQDYIKRVIAIEGDILEVRGGHPWINGWQVPSCAVGHFTYVEKGISHEGDLVVEYLDDESYLTFYAGSSERDQRPHYQGPFTVQKGEVWVMGDNRHNSHDSRFWFHDGAGVPFENIRGRALFVWLSIPSGGMDWSRLGAPVMGRPRIPSAFSSLELKLAQCLRERPPVDKTIPPPANGYRPTPPLDRSSPSGD